jgi:hypothetical protein
VGELDTATHAHSATTGNGAFAESNTLWREHTLGLSAKSFRREFFLALGEVILKKLLFTFKLFLSSACTYTKYMFKFDAILSIFVIFKNFNSFKVIFSNMSNANYISKIMIKILTRKGFKLYKIQMKFENHEFCRALIISYVEVVVKS